MSTSGCLTGSGDVFHKCVASHCSIYKDGTSVPALAGFRAPAAWHLRGRFMKFNFEATRTTKASISS